MNQVRPCGQPVEADLLRAGAVRGCLQWRGSGGVIQLQSNRFGRVSGGCDGDLVRRASLGRDRQSEPVGVVVGVQIQ